MAEIRWKSEAAARRYAGDAAAVPTEVGNQEGVDATFASVNETVAKLDPAEWGFFAQGKPSSNVFECTSKVIHVPDSKSG